MDIDLPKDVAKALENDPPTREEIDTFGTLAEDEDAWHQLRGLISLAGLPWRAQEKEYFIDMFGLYLKV